MRSILAGLFATLGMALSTPWAFAQIKAVPMPDPLIPGYHFPERESAILNLINPPIPGNATPEQQQAIARQAAHDLNLHGWGIWTALTSETDQVIDGQKIRVFETWYTPQELTAPGVVSLIAPHQFQDERE